MTRRSALLALGVLTLFPRGVFAAARPLITVYKDPNCGCCTGWADHLKQAGFPTKLLETTDLASVRKRLRIPAELAGCHSAEISGYAIEGHVPAGMIDKLLAENPPARGLAVPGMPNGSPGMSGEPEEYDVVLFGPQGRRTYGRFKGATEIK
jgi:hypothetical protein